MLGGAFDRFDVCRIVCFLSNTRLPQSTPRPILPTWRNERYVHVSGKVQQMCSSRTAMGSVPGSLLSPSACFLVSVCILPETGPGVGLPLFPLFCTTGTLVHLFLGTFRTFGTMTPSCV